MCGVHGLGVPKRLLTNIITTRHWPGLVPPPTHYAVGPLIGDKASCERVLLYVVLCPPYRSWLGKGPPVSVTRRPNHTLRIAFLERCVILGTYPPLPCLPVSSTMTRPSREQVVTVINQVQNAIEVVSNIFPFQATRSLLSLDLNEP